jgi:hypothetical protein
LSREDVRPPRDKVYVYPREKGQAFQLLHVYPVGRSGWPPCREHFGHQIDRHYALLSSDEEFLSKFETLKNNNAKFITLVKIPFLAFVSFMFFKKAAKT